MVAVTAIYHRQRWRRIFYGREYCIASLPQDWIWITVVCNLLSIYVTQEELYEWGNPKARLDKTNNDMANAAYRWRVKLQTDPTQLPTHGAFKDFRVILPKNNKQEQLRCLIMAGGGIVVDAKYAVTDFWFSSIWFIISNVFLLSLYREPYCRSPELSQTTHFVSNRMTLSAEDVKAFMKHKIICVSMMYLNAYVTSDEPPDVNKYLLKWCMTPSEYPNHELSHFHWLSLLTHFQFYKNKYSYYILSFHSTLNKHISIRLWPIFIICI